MSAHDVILSPGFAMIRTVTRTGAGARVAGRWVPGSTSTFDIVCNVQPFKGRRVFTDSTGRRIEGVISIRTKTELQISDTPDTFSHRGATWAVFEVETWEAFGGTSYRYFAAKQGVP